MTPLSTTPNATLPPGTRYIYSLASRTRCHRYHFQNIRHNPSKSRSWQIMYGGGRKAMGYLLLPYAKFSSSVVMVHHFYSVRVVASRFGSFTSLTDRLDIAVRIIPDRTRCNNTRKVEQTNILGPSIIKRSAHHPHPRIDRS